MNRMFFAVFLFLGVMLVGCIESGSSGGSSPSGGDSAGSIPQGAFWCSVTVTAPECIPVIGSEVTICDAKTVKRVEIVEESTTEIIGNCRFDGSDIAMTGDVPSGYRFWCERIDSGANTVEIKVYSMQANLPMVHVYWGSTEPDGVAGILHEEYVRPERLNGPDGKVYTDPYRERSFEFAGFKLFILKDQEYDFVRKNAVSPLREAGYDVTWRYTDGDGQIDVNHTLEGRVLIAEEILEKKGWRVKSEPDGNWGNKGTYQYAPLEIGALPIFVTEEPVWHEKPVSGIIVVTRASEGVTDAEVTINGIHVPHWSGGLYDVEAVDLALGPGDTVTVVAKTEDPEETRTLTFCCPDEIYITSPAEGTLVKPDEEINVTWSAGIAYEDWRMAGGPLLGNYACFIRDSGDEVSAIGHGEEFISLTVGQTNQNITLGHCRRYLLELQYPGELVLQEEDGANHSGRCSIRNRIWLQGPE